LFSSLKAEAGKSGLILFHEGMEKIDPDGDLEEVFALFERAAMKGHEESIWIGNVARGVEKDIYELKEAFSKTGHPLGLWFAGKFSEEEWEAFDFYKKSAERGCSWGQVMYGDSFKNGTFVKKDEKVYVEWLEKAAKQNNPEALNFLGDWFRFERGGNDQEKVVFYHRNAAELGWKDSMDFLAQMSETGEGCVKDLRQAAIWGTNMSNGYAFWNVLDETLRACESGATEDLGCDFNQLCY
jgi:TPR repeat protein